MSVDWNTVIIAFGSLVIWAAGARGTYVALGELVEDRVVIVFFSVIWPLTWPLVGGLSIVWHEG